MSKPVVLMDKKEIKKASGDQSGPAARAVDAKQNKNGIRRTDGPAPVSGLAPERRRDGFCKSSKNDKQIYTY